MDSATISLNCPNCDNDIVIDNRWTPGGVNDYGGYILQCTACDHIFSTHIGRDINDSRVTSGAKVVDQYDDEIGNKDEILKRHGLA
jgi:hypothetical protein